MFYAHEVKRGKTSMELFSVNNQWVLLLLRAVFLRHKWVSFWIKCIFIYLFIYFIKLLFSTPDFVHSKSYQITYLVINSPSIAKKEKKKKKKTSPLIDSLSLILSKIKTLSILPKNHPYQLSTRGREWGSFLPLLKHVGPSPFLHSYFIYVF